MSKGPFKRFQIKVNLAKKLYWTLKKGNYFLNCKCRNARKKSKVTSKKPSKVGVNWLCSHKIYTIMKLKICSQIKTDYYCSLCNSNYLYNDISINLTLNTTLSDTRIISRRLLFKMWHIYSCLSIISKKKGMILHSNVHSLSLL